MSLSIVHFLVLQPDTPAEHIEVQADTDLLQRDSTSRAAHEANLGDFENLELASLVSIRASR